MKIEERISAIEENMRKTSLNTKKVLSFEEAAQFTGISRSYLYKLTSKRLIPHYKPSGKLLYFTREELELWLTQNRVAETHITQ